MEDPEIEWQCYVPLIFEIKRQKHTLGKMIAYPANDAQQIAFVLAENDIKFLSFTLYKKINTKWIKDFNLIPETLPLLEENVRDAFQTIGAGKDFLNRTPTAQEPTSSINSWEYK